MTTELQTIEQPKSLTSTEVKAQVQRIQEVMKAVMQQGQHYGVVPGCGTKPTLLKPGAEKLMMTFRLAVDPQVEDLSVTGIRRYRVITRVTAQSTGLFLGSGVGECSSDEEKYAWREAVCKEEWEETDAGNRRDKWKRGRQGEEPYVLHQIRTNASDVANTILKMAKKRSLVDAILTVTAASDIFTQDLEEMVDSGTPPTTDDAPISDSQPSYRQPASAPEPYRLKSGKHAGKSITDVPRDFLEWARDNAKPPLNKLASEELTRRSKPAPETGGKPEDFVASCYTRLNVCTTTDAVDELIDKIWIQADALHLSDAHREEIKKVYDSKRAKLR